MRARVGALVCGREPETFNHLARPSRRLAPAAGTLHLLWAGGAPLGLPPLLLQSRDANFDLLHATYGLAALCAAAGVVLLINRRGRWPLWVPLSLAWTGSGAMFSWGSWLLLAVVSPFSRGLTSWLLTANNVIKIGAGLLIGALIVSLVASQTGAASQR